MEQILKNEELLVGLVNVNTPEELAKLFSEHNIQLEEGLNYEQAFEMVKAQENAELNEEDLDNVNGGIALAVALGAAATFTFAAATICFIAGYAYQKFRR